MNDQPHYRTSANRRVHPESATTANSLTVLPSGDRDPFDPPQPCCQGTNSCQHTSVRLLPSHDMACCEPGCTDCHCDGDESCVKCSPVHDAEMSS